MLLHCFKTKLNANLTSDASSSNWWSLFNQNPFWLLGLASKMRWMTPLLKTLLFKCRLLKLSYTATRIFSFDKLQRSICKTPITIIHVRFGIKILAQTSIWLMKTWQTSIKQGVCHIVALPFTLKSILRQKKNYENSNISSCK